MKTFKTRGQKKARDVYTRVLLWCVPPYPPSAAHSRRARKGAHTAGARLAVEASSAVPDPPTQALLRMSEAEIAESYRQSGEAALAMTEVEASYDQRPTLQPSNDLLKPHRTAKRNVS